MAARPRPRPRGKSCSPPIRASRIRSSCATDRAPLSPKPAPLTGSKAGGACSKPPTRPNSTRTRAPSGSTASSGIPLYRFYFKITQTAPQLIVPKHLLLSFPEISLRKRYQIWGARRAADFSRPGRRVSNSLACAGPRGARLPRGPSSLDALFLDCALPCLSS
jgi:hypothetical protein